MIRNGHSRPPHDLLLGSARITAANHAGSAPRVENVYYLTSAMPARTDWKFGIRSASARFPESGLRTCSASCWTQVLQT